MDNGVFDWPTVREVARRLNVSQQYISRMIAARRLGAVRTPLGFFVDPASVSRYEGERTVRSQRREVA